MTKLKLPQFKVLNTIGTKNIIFEVECQTKQTNCIHCQSQDLYRHGSIVSNYIDIPINQSTVKIAVKVDRFRCKACLKTFLQPVPNVHKTRRITNRCIDYIHALSESLNPLSISKIIGCDPKTIRTILQAKDSNQQNPKSH